MTDKKRTPTVIAATAANRIIQLRSACEQEIATAPESIRARYAEREAKALAGLDPTVREYVDGILERHYAMVAGAQKATEAPDTEAPKGERGRKT